MADNNKPVVEKTVVTREGAEGGAREYRAPDKKGAFPWWLIPLVLIPLLIFAFSRRGPDTDQVASATTTPPMAMATASPSPGADTSPSSVASPAPDMTEPNKMDAAQKANENGTDPGTAAATGVAANAPVSGVDAEGKSIKVHKGDDIAVAPKAGASKPGETLSDVVTFATAPDKMALIGRKVQLKNVSVLSVLNPRAFYVGPSASQEMLVLLAPRLTPTGSKDILFKAGDKVSLTGDLKAIPDASAMQSDYQVAQDDYTNLQKQGAYLNATVAQEKGQ